HNAGVTVVIVGVSNVQERRTLRLFDGDEQISAKNINPYLVNGADVFVSTRPNHISALPTMMTGAMPRDGGHLILSSDEKAELTENRPGSVEFIRRYIASEELINGKVRHRIWVADARNEAA